MLIKGHFQAEWKSVEVKAGKITITGRASTPDIDRQDDIVETIAVEKSLATYMKNPVVLMQHDTNKPIGRCIKSKVMPEWWDVTIEITENTDGVFEKINNKVLGAFSIGFIAKTWKMEDKEVGGTMKRIRTITELDIVEISVVSTPANPNAVFTIAKSLKNLFDKIEKSDEENVEKDGETEGIVSEKSPLSNSVQDSNSVLEQNAGTNSLEGGKADGGAIEWELKGIDKDEIIIDKDTQNTQKSMLPKAYFEEKRVLLTGELSVGDTVRFICHWYNMWDDSMQMEVKQGEILKISENEDITNPTLYILEYELSLDGFIPSKGMTVLKFRDSTYEKIDNEQLKKIAIEAGEKQVITEATTESKDESIETPPETVADENSDAKTDETLEEVNVEDEIQKHFQTKSLELDEKFQNETKAFVESMEAKMAEVEAKELSMKTIHNEIAEMKSAVMAENQKANAMMERLLKIAINKGVATLEKQPATFNYFN